MAKLELGEGLDVRWTGRGIRVEAGRRDGRGDAGYLITRLWRSLRVSLRLLVVVLAVLPRNDGNGGNFRAQ